MAETGFGIKHGDDLFKGIKAKKPIIDNFLYENEVMCIQGKPGCCKSILVQQLMFYLTTGNDMFDTCKVLKEYNVCWIQTEGDKDETKERIDNMSRAINYNRSRFSWGFYDGLRLNVDKSYREFEEEMLATKIDYDVIIFDPLYTTVKGSLTRDEVASDWIINVRRLKSLFDPCAIIVTHHVNKDSWQEGRKIERGDGSVFGAFAWEAYFNVVYKLTFNKNTKLSKLICGKGRSSKEIKLIEMKLIEPVPLYFATDEKNVPGSASLVETYIRKHDKITRRDLIKEIHGDSHTIAEITIDRALKRHRGNNVLTDYYEDGIQYLRWVK